MSQPLPFPTAPGTPIVVRGRRFRLEAAHRWPDCVELHMAPANGGEPVRLLWPFDRPRAGGADSPRLVRRQRARHVLRATLAEAVPRDGLRAAAGARIDLLPFQLEPALAIASAQAHRLLLADAVGLGKTIQAGLALAELSARGALRRGLVVTPAGLRDQWASELADRFGLDATVVDLAWLRRARADIGPDLNPWLVPRLAVASYDFLKRPEVLRGIEPLLWDALVVDEAHAAGPGTDRAAALHRLARRARHVLLLTATPHAGDDQAFRDLCALGAVQPDEPVLFFRRTRSDVGLPSHRRTHLLRVRLAPAAARLHAALAAYAKRVWTEAAGGTGARLAMEVLMRRACSSAASLLRSLARRLAALEQGAPAGETQLLLPLDLEDDRRDEEPADLLATPGLADAARERAALAGLIAQARAVAAHDPKLRRLVRLLRAAREPAVIFTEYRDTLDELARAIQPFATTAVLHGALGRAERAAVVRSFTRGGVRVLLATDAAGEGLNLHDGCRLVINLELPWSPRRLEQRAGRVDRIGQRRRVHVINLIGGGTSEERVLAALIRRAARVRRAIGTAADSIGVPDETIARAMVAGEGPDISPHMPCDPAPASPLQIDMRSQGAIEAGRLQAVRRAAPPGAGRAPIGLAIYPGAGADSNAGCTLLVLASLVWTDGADRIVERESVGLSVSLAAPPETMAAWRRVAAALGPSIATALQEAIRSRQAPLEHWLRERGDRVLARERGIAAAVEADALRDTQPLQQRLFDRRAERHAAARTADLGELRAALRRALAEHATAASTASARIDIRLIVCRSSDAGRD